MTPLVSIIVPCYNQAIYLSEALDSVLSQNYLNWECIIINDGSLDNTEEIANIYLNKDARFKYIYQNNSGLSAARNIGIRNSSGKYILPLDSDDIIGSEYVKMGVDILGNDDKVKIVYCQAKFFGDKTGYWNLPDFSIEEILVKNIIFCTALYRRTDYDKTKGYDEKMVYGLEDWDLWLSILEQGGTAYKIPRILFYYRQRSNSMSKKIDTQKRAYLKKQIYIKHLELYLDYLSDFMNKYQAIEQSKEYRLGEIILKPFRWLSRKFKKILLSL